MHICHFCSKPAGECGVWTNLGGVWQAVSCSFSVCRAGELITTTSSARLERAKEPGGNWWRRLFPSAPLARITCARLVDRGARICSPVRLSREGLLAVYMMLFSVWSTVELRFADTQVALLLDKPVSDLFGQRATIMFKREAGREVGGGGGRGARLRDGCDSRKNVIYTPDWIKGQRSQQVNTKRADHPFS